MAVIIRTDRLEFQ